MPLKMMLGFRSFKPPPPLTLFPPLSSSLQSHDLTFHTQKLKRRKRFSLYYSQNNSRNGNRQSSVSDIESENGGRSRLKLNWVDLVLDPDPDNIFAVGLTGILTWAGVQILWQLFVISIAILITALKYTVVAALLVVIIIILL